MWAFYIKEQTSKTPEKISENRICTVNFHGLTCMNVAVAFACFEISHAKL